jgi:hypothetical protein
MCVTIAEWYLFFTVISTTIRVQLDTSCNTNGDEYFTTQV